MPREPIPTDWITQRPRIEPNMTGDKEKVKVMISNDILQYIPIDWYLAQLSSERYCTAIDRNRYRNPQSNFK